MAALTTCLWFDTQAEEAANHYSSIFEDAKIAAPALERWIPSACRSRSRAAGDPRR